MDYGTELFCVDDYIETELHMARFKNGCFGVTRASGIGPRFWGGICGFDNGFERGDERARSDSLRLKRT